MARHNLRIKRIKKNLVSINGELIKLAEHGGCRPKCFYGGYVIKFDDDEDINTADQEVAVWKRISKQHRQHFAKLVGWNVKAGYVIQELVKFKRGRKSNAAKDIVYQMIVRYDLEDVCTFGENSNWGVSLDGVPKIFDWAADY